MKKVWIIIILLCSQKTYTQTNNSSQRNLPAINVLTLNDSVYETGKIAVKFNRTSFDRLHLTSANINELSSNNAALNQIASQFKFNKFSLMFSNVLKQKDLITKHQQWNLDLWFNIEFDKIQNVKLLYMALQKTNLFDVVEPVYKKHLLDVVDDGQLSVNFTPNDPKFNEQWSYNNTGQGNGTAGKDIKLIDAWDIETGKPNVLVAVHDMGIQLDHPDLAQNIAVGKSFNFIDNNDTIVQGYHGTHTAGTIAAVNNNGIGVSGIAGGDGTVNSGVRLMSVQIFKGFKSAGLAEGFVYAADKGAAISSNSWAYDAENIYELSVMDAIDYFIANGGGNALQGGLVIFAAGNVSRTIKYYPSAYDRVICVASTNNRDTKANYSTFGSWVDIAAPGGDYNNGPSSQILSTTSFSGYSGDHGTSMACPHVAGVAALIASKLSGKASASDVRDILLSTTDNIDTLNPNFIGLLGTGRLNALKALQKSQSIFTGLYVVAIDSVWAINNCNSLSINWNKNSNNNDVIIAYSNTNGIGSLTNGTVYNIGDKLVGEGTIIYKGNANGFTLLNNNSFLHYFKVWSVDGSNQYSYGKTAEIVGTAYTNGSGSIMQNFDFPPYFPTQEWRTINPNNDISWIHTAADTSNTGAGDAYSMVMYNYNYNSLLGAVDILTSPLYKVTNTDSLELSFWYAYKYRNTGLPIADSLEVLVSADCGTTYTSLWKKGGFDLATINSTTDSIFYPFGIDKWQQVKLNLTSYNTNNNLMFAFRSLNGKGNNLFIDNIGVDVRYKRDIAISSLISPINASCDTIIYPKVVVKNNGNNNINTLQINYAVDGGSVVNTNWNGNLGKNDSVIITLNQTTVTRGNHQIKVYTLLPNNLNDEYNMNDTLANNFFVTPITIIPVAEEFEGNSFPPQNWYIYQEPVDAISWTKTNFAGSASLSSCKIPNYYYNNEGKKDDIITPVFESNNNGDTCYLVFDYAHATKFVPTSIGINFDSLEIDATNDCGNTWTKIWIKGGNGLQTINQIQSYDIEFIPKINQWRKDSLLIPLNFNVGDKIQARFRSIENFGNNIYLDNIKLFSKYTQSILVPVKLGNYEIKLAEDFVTNKRQVTNYWNTLQEINTSHFNIQRSIDGTSFNTIGRVDARGIAANYNFKDDLVGIDITPKQIFYRLEVVNIDGKKEYSLTRNINLINNKRIINISPNPVSSKLNINLKENANKLKNISLINIDGRKVGILNWNQNASYPISFDVSKYPTGQYYLHFLFNDRIEVEKIVIVR